ncbi:MAG: hypothetical protein JJE13_01505 [Thermoleophilia bacterium]|nr:hypothetical protein [Thermoleophilia bacterium]
MRGISLLGSLAIAALLLFLAPAAHALQAEVGSKKTLADGVTQQITYEIPLKTVTSGQNKIRNKLVSNDSEKPTVDGWITSFKPNLIYSKNGQLNAGQIPSSSKVMFHHGVFINISSGGPFFATGEEKTQMLLPDGYGYRYRASDIWYLNEMIHNLTPAVMELTATYTIEFIPDTAPEAAAIKPAEPIWMDVENGQNGGYPVFDVLRDSGGADGEFSYPQDDPDAYPPGVHLNEWKAGQDGVLLGTTGHVHTGGLSTELFMKRPGAGYTGSTCDQPVDRDAEYASLTTVIEKTTGNQAKIKALLKTKAIKKLKKSMKPGKMKKLRKSMAPRKFKKMKRRKTKRLKRLKKVNSAKLAQLRQVSKRRQDAISDKTEVEAKADAEQKAYDDCTATIPTVEGNRVRLFESTAHYFEPAGPVSWDMAMVSTKDDWRVQVKQGDTLEIQTTYETEIGSWYESMGINVVFWAPGEENGRDPYKTKVDTPGVLNHGHYPENDDHGGELPVVGQDPTTRPDGLMSGGPFDIGGYSYEAGNFRLPGTAGNPPVVEQGDSFTFQLTAADANQEIWHSLTSCKVPCNKSTGIAYPLPDGEFQFDSGQLGNLNGNAAPPTVGRTTWSTPANLPVGTHTFFCRIHPLMRGAFRVKPKS